MMAKRIATKIDNVRAGINKQLDAERSGLTHFGRGLQREGYVGGYLQALSDVALASRGIVDINSRFAELWREQNEPTSE